MFKRNQPHILYFSILGVTRLVASENTGNLTILKIIRSTKGQKRENSATKRYRTSETATIKPRHFLYF